MNSFFDRWQHLINAVTLDHAPVDHEPDGPTLLPTRPPQDYVSEQLGCRMIVLADGGVPIDECTLDGSDCIGNIHTMAPTQLWPALRAERANRAPNLGLFRP